GKGYYGIVETVAPANKVTQLEALPAPAPEARRCCSRRRWAAVAIATAGLLLVALAGSLFAPRLGWGTRRPDSGISASADGATTASTTAPASTETPTTTARQDPCAEYTNGVKILDISAREACADERLHDHWSIPGFLAQ
ncbi:unnamed protein product, partial [Prorocentrum cordatum]